MKQQHWFGLEFEDGGRIFSATRGCLVQALQGSSTYQPWTSMDIYIILYVSTISYGFLWTFLSTISYGFIPAQHELKKNLAKQLILF